MSLKAHFQWLHLLLYIYIIGQSGLFTWLLTSLMLCVLTPNDRFFLRNFSWQFYLLSEFMPEICWDEIIEEIIFVFCFNDWPGTRTLALRLPTSYPSLNLYKSKYCCLHLLLLFLFIFILVVFVDFCSLVYHFFVLVFVVILNCTAICKQVCLLHCYGFCSFCL